MRLNRLFKRVIPVVSLLTILASCQTGRYSEYNERSQDREDRGRKVAQEVPEQPPEYLAPQSFDMLSKYTPFKYEVLFTDPKCGVYKYKKDATVLSVKGTKLTQKPENVYCKNMYDLKRSGDQLSSPQNRLVSWINDPRTTEVFFTYLSFSNKAVFRALCDRAKAGNGAFKIKFVMDSGQDMTRANELLACHPSIERKLRGGNMGADLVAKDKIGLAHNKFFIINPNTPGEFKVVFSSGNMTSGPVIHHENWNFITTNSQSQFAQAHLCAMNAEWGEDTGTVRSKYINSIKNCRAQIKTPVEKDIKAFFVPGEGEFEKAIHKKGTKTASDYMINGDGKFPGIKNASKIWIGCHRFFYNRMLTALHDRMFSGSTKPEMKIVADDDTYYTKHDPNFSSDLMEAEYDNTMELVGKGALVKYMESNASEHQLHHSKYLIFADKAGKFTSVFTGSANLTGAGFRTNWENSYYVAIPEVAQQFADHYVKMWNTMATDAENLPTVADVSAELKDKPIIDGIDPNPEE